MTRTAYRIARHIQPAERDVRLDLDAAEWPAPGIVPAGWQHEPHLLWREIEEPHPGVEEPAASPPKLMAGPIRETVLRFPSAPLHGWQRLHEYHVNLGASENVHTYRVFTHPDRAAPVDRIILMHNGLNEIGRMGLYYQLASHLIAESPTTACILRPFPGHLTRFPFHAFAETPLDRYLWDGSHLFRQFLRYMIETQWFLSALVRRSDFRNPSGANLLAQHSEPSKSRLEPSVLAKATARAWRRLYERSMEIIAVLHTNQPDAAGLKPPPEGDQLFADAVTSLRTTLGLDEYPRLDGELREDDREPSVHVLGYSLGGFTAQSVFMTWPFLVASCATLLSGGALRELAPTAFAHPEEWQTVLHSLRYELDDAMMSGLYGPEQPSQRKGAHQARTGIGDDDVAGIERDLFLNLKRTFYEVFQQEYRGSFQSRLVAFRQRMLFVVGGDDPIVRPRSVLDSGPPDGINMLAIGGLGHFLEAQASDDEEEDQRSFWLPEIARLVNRLAAGTSDKQLAERPSTWLDPKMRFLEPPPRKGEGGGHGVRRLSAPERLALAGDGALSAELFERCLDDLLARVGESTPAGGLLFILRNELPTFVLDPLDVYDHAAILNHDDLGIARYAQGVSARREALFKHRERIALILPWNAKRLTKQMDAHAGFPSQGESAKGQMPNPLQPIDSWTAGYDTCRELAEEEGHASVRVFDGRAGLSAQQERDDGIAPLARAATQATKGEIERVPSLPDCWVWMSREFFTFGEDDPLTIETGLRRLPEIIPVQTSVVTALDGRLRKDDVRIVTVSRARYNPRFRGRIIADPKTAKELLLHVALCAAASVPLTQFDFDAQG